MKRTSPLRTQGIRSSDPFQNLSLEQLAYIGAIAMLYNDLEDIIDGMCGRCLVDSVHSREITSRINGVEGKNEIVKHAAKQWGCDDREMAELEQTLGLSGFLLLKGWRDAVVHARVFDICSSVARTRARKGKIADVLLHVDALKGLFDRMEEMRVELNYIDDILATKHRIIKAEIGDRHKESLEEDVQAYWTQVREHRSQRLSLPPMPEWPEDKLDFVRFRETLAKAAKEPKAAQ